MLACSPSVFKKQIVIMEDQPENQRSIKEAIESLLEWEVKIVQDKDEAVAYAKEQEAVYYILDVHMGNKRNQEGLDALEEIKQVNPNAFVAIFSALGDYKSLAERLKADIFLKKTPNLEQDIREIASKMLEYRLNCIKENEEETRRKLDEIYQVDSDSNIIAYERLKAQNFQEYEGNYVAFVDGNFVDSDKIKRDLLKRVREKYSEKPRFLRKVEKKVKVIDIPYFDIV